MANSLRGQTTVTIGDDQFEVLLNMNAFRLMCQDRGMELQQMDDFLGKSPLDFVPSIVFWGIMNAADYKGDARPDITFDRLAAVVCADMDQFTQLSGAIGSSLGIEVNDDGKK